MEGNNTSCVPELTAGMSEASTRTAETAASLMPPLSPDKSAGGFFMLRENIFTAAIVSHLSLHFFLRHLSLSLSLWK